jgi:thymidylate synthase (FAD)
MSEVNLVWVTPNADQMIGYIARVSNVNAKPNDDASSLIAYLIKHKHWSPFTMANMCLEIITERDISRQIIRHKSLQIQEFSQRYMITSTLPAAPNRPARMQDPKNRQKSNPCDDPEILKWWDEAQAKMKMKADVIYTAALGYGIAKEVARSILPEGLTTTRMYVSGDIRSWLHYCDVRRGNGTQPEHIEVADKCYAILKNELPDTVAAWEALSALPGQQPAA